MTHSQMIISRSVLNGLTSGLKCEFTYRLPKCWQIMEPQFNVFQKLIFETLHQTGQAHQMALVDAKDHG
jgi:hypothetical protein